MYAIFSGRSVDRLSLRFAGIVIYNYEGANVQQKEGHRISSTAL